MKLVALSDFKFFGQPPSDVIRCKAAMQAAVGTSRRTPVPNEHFTRRTDEEC